jgi:Mg/Co/Ni transporter MgtE
MTEEQIEAAIARKTDALDRRYLTTSLTEEEYKAALKEIDAWAEAQYRAAAGYPGDAAARL